MRSFLISAAVLIMMIGASASAQPLPPVEVSSRTFTMSDAIHLAIENNLSMKLALAGTDEARGQAIETAAALLPHLNAYVQQARVFKINLEAQGFPANNPFFSSLIGPFNSFDARIQLAQSFFDLSAYYKSRAGVLNRRIAELQEQLAREQVAAAAALAYLEAQRARRAVIAAEADSKLSGSLLKLARDQHEAGVSTGVDVARAETSAAQEQLRLIRARVSAQQADLRLERVLGLPLGRPISLPHIEREAVASLPDAEKAAAEASHARAELQLATEYAEAGRYSLLAAQTENLPTLKAAADYGFSGTIPENTARTGSIGGRLDLPIFAGGAAHGRTVTARARLQGLQSRLADTRSQVEEDVRLSVQTLAAEIEEAKTSQQVVQLAQRELSMARDRYAAGIGDNIQLLNAQDALDRALDDQVDALARFDTARVNFATAQGTAQRFE